MKKKIYKSVLRVEILSEEPINDPELNDIHWQITNGDWSGAQGWEQRNIELIGKPAAEATIHQGSHPEFFQMDAEGNVLHDEYLYEDPEECLESGDHLKSCDEDGFCNYCGHQ